MSFGTLILPQIAASRMRNWKRWIADRRPRTEDQGRRTEAGRRKLRHPEDAAQLGQALCLCATIASNCAWLSSMFPVKEG